MCGSTSTRLLSCAYLLLPLAAARRRSSSRAGLEGKTPNMARHLNPLHMQPRESSCVEDFCLFFDSSQGSLSSATIDAMGPCCIACFFFSDSKGSTNQTVCQMRIGEGERKCFLTLYFYTAADIDPVYLRGLPPCLDAFQSNPAFS
eukprot:c17627_g1_i1 orf=60-497(+)